MSLVVDQGAAPEVVVQGGLAAVELGDHIVLADRSWRAVAAHSSMCEGSANKFSSVAVTVEWSDLIQTSREPRMPTWSVNASLRSLSWRKVGEGRCNPSRDGGPARPRVSGGDTSWR